VLSPDGNTALPVCSRSAATSPGEATSVTASAPKRSSSARASATALSSGPLSEKDSLHAARPLGNGLAEKLPIAQSHGRSIGLQAVMLFDEAAGVAGGCATRWRRHAEV